MLDPLRPSRVIALVAVLAAFFAVASPASAQITDLEEAGPITDDVQEPYPNFIVGITGFGAFGSVSMQEFNEAIDLVNLEIVLQGTQVKFDHFSNFLGYGAGIRTIFLRRGLLDVSFEKLTRSQTIGGISAENTLEIPANTIQISLGYDFLGTRRDTRFGFLAGIARYDSQTRQVLSETREGEQVIDLGTIEISGSSWGSQYGLFFETPLTEKLFLSTQVMYRLAKVKDLEYKGIESLVQPENNQAFVAVPIVDCFDADGNRVDCTPDPDDENAPIPVSARLKGGGDELDWSGFEGRVGFTYYFNIPTYW